MVNDHYERLSILLCLFLIGLASTRLMELPARTFSFMILGSPLGFTLSVQWLMAAILVALTASGTEVILRSHPESQGVDRQPTFPHWVPPCLMAISAVFGLPLLLPINLWLVGLGLSGLLLGLLVEGEYYLVTPGGSHFGPVRWTLEMITYLLALILFTMIYASKVRSLLSATTTGALSAVLALSLLHRPGQRLARPTISSLVVGLIMAEIVWALNFWRLESLVAGVFLLLMFYVATGLARQRLKGQLTRGLVLELAFVTLLALFLSFRFLS
ncbi:MAG: hypothetical protein ACE5NP_06915 [Anaerolineae bacterium]